MVSGMLVLAHRGANRLAPENTVPAMELAVERGADGVELDVHRAADGSLVVRHDAGCRFITSYTSGTVRAS